MLKYIKKKNIPYYRKISYKIFGFSIVIMIIFSYVLFLYSSVTHNITLKWLVGIFAPSTIISFIALILSYFRKVFPKNENTNSLNGDE